MEKKNATSMPTLKGLEEKGGPSSAADDSLPPIESLSVRPTMPAKISISPLELAHLTAALTQAHLVQGSLKEKARQAMDFLLWCGHLNEDFAWRYLAARYEQAEEEIIGPLLAKYASSVIIPVKEVISAAKLDYLKLERSELLLIGIDVDFSSLMPEPRACAIFRFLTRCPLEVMSLDRGALTMIVKQKAFKDTAAWASKAAKGVSLDDILCGLLSHLQQSAKALEADRRKVEGRLPSTK